MVAKENVKEGEEGVNLNLAHEVDGRLDSVQMLQQIVESVTRDYGANIIDIYTSSRTERRHQRSTTHIL